VKISKLRKSEREKRDFLSLLWRASETEGEVILS
jgi:hypothetical protein